MNGEQGIERLVGCLGGHLVYLRLVEAKTRAAQQMRGPAVAKGALNYVERSHKRVVRAVLKRVIGKKEVQKGKNGAGGWGGRMEP